VREYSASPKSEVLSTRARFSSLAAKPVESREWITEVLGCVGRVEDGGMREFTNEDLYSLEPELSERHPGDVNIRPRLRQKLQDAIGSSGESQAGSR
jgi:hypothetical protein